MTNWEAEQKRQRDAGLLTEDGKTMDEEARDSMQMLGGVLILGIIVTVAVIVYWLA
jgi:hypothetical protein